MKILILQGGENWKRKLVQPPNTFDGSFVDADMQQFRPEPIMSATDDPWFASRVPNQSMASFDRLSNPAATYSYPELPMTGPYGTMYPQDELSLIKMRNRRFMNACSQDQGGMMMQQQPQMMMMMPPQTLDYNMAQDELCVSWNLF